MGIYEWSDAMEWRKRALKAESELRLEQGLRETYMRCSIRRLEKIDKLEAQAKADQDYMGLLAKRLIRARNHISRIRYHCDLPEPQDNGPSLDP